MPIWKRNLWVCWFGTFFSMAGMSQISPFLPLYIEQLGVHDTASIEKWAGIAFGATFLLSAIFSPIWGKAADKYGRKPMLLRASLGMAVIISLMGFAQNVYELTAMRMIMGIVSGFVSAATTLVASQTPKQHSGWALGTLATGSVGGTLLGPMLGGYLSEFTGIRGVFFITGGLMLISFLASLFFVKEDFTPNHEKSLPFLEVWRKVPNTNLMISMFITTFILQIANVSIQPIITVYIKQISGHASHIALISGMVVAASGLSSMIAAPQLGKLSDKIGPKKVLFVSLIVAGIVFIPQAFVKNEWELMVLRFMLGMATAGLLPSINTLVKRNSPNELVGRVYGYKQAAQNYGTLAGALFGSQMAALFGIHYVFFITASLLLINAVWVKISEKMDFHIEKNEA